jgi:glycosidase
MGANYQKKMGQLKPNLKIIKMLENNGLLNEEKLYNLIDLSKKDLKAITKLVKESDIDPLDIDKDVPTDYQPTDYSISDKEYNLDQVLDEIKDTDTFNRTINVLTKDWDTRSKETISEYPEIISIINTHMSNGVFDKVNTILQSEKALGKLTGVADVDAYRQITEYLAKTGDLRERGSNIKTSESTNVLSKTDEKANADRNKKRKAVAPVKQTTTKKAASDEDFLGLSDEAFMKKYAVR